ncbi:hypothetical protein B0T17DRAFT_610577 [Bombardia bombarda]|uniref:Fungal-type protein kinase domain-containing protein n=1 Tax=Bombardia bombarda TaxID=252184 RepID=A0AA39WBJ0_9PEZI|nr:hypothetical protein B0T17DRAFT_610577 [Bombardia bombarda]
MVWQSSFAIQYPEYDKEGELIHEATNQSVVNVARYYYYETVQVYSTDDDIRNNGCIEGHESLRRKIGCLHRDISIGNLMINEDDGNLSWPSFLIDLDLAAREQRDGASGAKGMTGTRAFMAIRALLGEQHSFMHDLESFFWVLFWICIHYKGPGESRAVSRFDRWNYVDTEELAGMKLGVVADEPLIPLLNRLRKIVFPQGKPWNGDDEKLYSQMREFLRKG